MFFPDFFIFYFVLNFLTSYMLLNSDKETKTKNFKNFEKNLILVILMNQIKYFISCVFFFKLFFDNLKFL